MIRWANLEGRQFWYTMGKALPPVSAVTNGLNPLSLLCNSTLEMKNLTLKLSMVIKAQIAARTIP